jgi:hypothetical protein
MGNVNRMDTQGILWSLVALVLLIGAGTERLLLAAPADAAPYHRRVRDAAARIPLHFGDWSGTDAPLEYDVTRALHPNVLICRDYQEASTGRQFWFLLVQCDDADALAGHYPPNCYPSIGYTLTSTEPRTWRSGTVSVNGAEFSFSRDDLDPSSSIKVAGFLELPDGTTTSNMNLVFALGDDLQKRFYGAAQAQLLFGAEVPRADRDRIISQFLSEMHETIQAIGARADGASAAAAADR